jgi:gamma-glutamyl-gamma-aminobutyrate hydrolase PuuD
MKNKMVIGIIGEERIYNKQILVVFSDKILDLILKYDAIPLGILPTNIHVEQKLSDNEKQKLYDMLDLCDGVILQGGYNIFEYQMEAVKYIRDKDIPVLGICLGMQIMVLSNNGIKRAIIDNSHRQKKKHAHSIKIEKDSKLYSIINKEDLLVNSRHFCYIENVDDYIVSARSNNDNIIEAIELTNKLFHIGVQFHPEDLYETDIEMKKLINAFFEACYKYRGK